MEAFSVETNSKVHYKSSDLLEIMKGYQDGKVELQIIVSFNKPEEAVSSYKERWQIETAFKAMKTSGFNIEDTHLTDIDRIERLFVIITIAFTWAYLVGIYKDANIKPIRILKNGRRAQDSSSTPLMNDNQTSQEET